MATTGEQAYRKRYKRTNEQARGDIRIEGAGRAGSYISNSDKTSIERIDMGMIAKN